MSMSVDAAGSSTLDPYQSSGQGNTQALQQLAQLEQLIQQLIAELQMFSQLNNLAKQNSSPSVGGAGGGGGGGGGMPALSVYGYSRTGRLMDRGTVGAVMCLRAVVVVPDSAQAESTMDGE
ncbi:hypothetical protein F3J16_28385 [Burkholderia sp. Ap-962]|uniref:hypothetical protein n=1 Tax=Burkholderia sp. Ap-962 TaxID=2608333 RepID=UPI00141F6512|nr:hypothetical protein [Burkholderia sp. Ap-962]NIF74064.1 hypothetical protein [Burkholderia sp. Ap-962]